MEKKIVSRKLTNHPAKDINISNMADEYAGFKEAERRERLESLKEAASYTGENYDLYRELTKDDPDRWIGH